MELVWEGSVGNNVIVVVNVVVVYDKLFGI